MKVIIVGIGKFGRKVLQYLSEENCHDVVVIDKDSEKIRSIVDRYDVMGLCGNGCSAENLEEAGVSSADLLIAVTPSDEQNVLCSMIAKSLGVKGTIARVRDPEYVKQADFMRNRFGIDRLMNPERALAKEITRVLKFPSAEKIYAFADGRAEIVEIRLPATSPFADKKLKELTVNGKPLPVLISAVERDGEIIIPNGETTLKAGDILSVCAKHAEIYEFLKCQGMLKKKVQYVMILGADRMAYYLAENLSKLGMRVKVISPNKEKCETIAEELDEVSIACGDFNDKEVLYSEGISDADAIVAMSGYDENNVMLSLFAKKEGVPKIVTVLRNESYTSILDGLSLDSVVSPYQVVAEDVVRYLRSISVPADSRIVALYRIAGDKAETLQFNVHSHKEFTDVAIKDLSVKLREGVLITAIIRGKAFIIPRGDTVIEKDDSLILIGRTGSVISSLDDVLR